MYIVITWRYGQTNNPGIDLEMIVHFVTKPMNKLSFFVSNPVPVPNLGMENLKMEHQGHVATEVRYATCRSIGITG